MYYCKSCKITFEEPKRYSENRAPYGEGGGGNWVEYYDGCPRCSGGFDEVFFCEECNEYKKRVEFYPFANEYMCDDCYEEMMENGELVENQMEEVINNDVGRGLPNEEREEI